MELSVFIKGIFVGFIVAVPIGPIGILCIRKTLTEGQARGLLIGFGAATADLIFAFLAVFGLSVITGFIDDQLIWFRLIGGFVLLFIGIKIFRTKTTKSKYITSVAGMLKSYISIVLLTLTNPLTIFAYIGIFALLGVKEKLDFISSAFLVIGVFIGSIIWFLFLSSLVILFKKNFNTAGFQRINKISGALILVSFVFIIISLL